ncbi:SDR family NAD(P)-dependent oxidoreductase [Amycolatopsis australiensis]|uniref:NAD(P)-dependent dehydrogenase, short-chain alcohol dehydrogenase family n=1 Tax=Amycolatopsis australiensis TaxID=546364 RepID=A0A1K1SMK3_9PSEU|nr:SDR family NAD(P)-dependent oxidoreductase [Amycolatopsis australiensis]SFW85526.1 NAD(P)-dependent dehydrogenase, short-chain alcohol dehydrogenase family [Amycolatopsis australiensis]
MARIFVTGCAQGLGRLTAEALLADGHRVVVHARGAGRLADLAARGADVVTGDLADLGQTRGVAEQVNRLGRMDAVIHNAGVMTGPTVLPVNVVAPYLLTALVTTPPRLVYLSSGMHRGGRPELDGLDWSGARPTASYSDSKLLLTTLAAAVARRWPRVRSNAVDPGWVPTRMGGPGAPDDLQLGAATQAWLATSDDPQATTTGGYWFHRRHADRHPAAGDPDFQDRLLDALAAHTGTPLPE